MIYLCMYVSIYILLFSSCLPPTAKWWWGRRRRSSALLLVQVLQKLCSFSLEVFKYERVCRCVKVFSSFYFSLFTYCSLLLLWLACLVNEVAVVMVVVVGGCSTIIFRTSTFDFPSVTFNHFLLVFLLRPRLLHVPSSRSLSLFVIQTVFLCKVNTNSKLVSGWFVSVTVPSRQTTQCSGYMLL